MIIVQELDRSTNAIGLISNGETFDKMTQFIAHLGAVGVGLKKPTIKQPFGKKDAIIESLKATFEYPEGKRLFKKGAAEKAEANLDEAMSKHITPREIGGEDADRLADFEAGIDYEQISSDGLVAVGSLFSVLAGPIEESFTAGDREFNLAKQLGLSHEAMQYRITDTPHTAELDDPLNQTHASLGNLDQNGEFHPTVTVLNDWYIERMRASFELPDSL